MNTLEITKKDLIKKILVSQNEKLIIKINNFIDENEILESKKKEILKIQKTKISEKYKGVFTKIDAESFNKHTKQMRNDW